MRLAIVAFVSWQLFTLAVRNPVDLWPRPIRRWAHEKLVFHDSDDKAHDYSGIFDAADDWTDRYANFTGCEQGWTMFRPNLARSAPFLTACITFDDGSTELVHSQNEPDVHSYVRMGGARLRKLESCLYRRSPDELPGDDDLPVFASYVRWSIQRWRSRAAEDPRTPVRVELVKRRYRFPNPDENPGDVVLESTTTVGTFDAEGNLLR
jgi:hypothetical protein